MSVKRLLKAFVTVSVLAISATTAYNYAVEEKTPLSAAWQAMETYNSVLNGLVITGLDFVERRYFAED